MGSRANQHYRKLDLSVCRVRLQPLPSVYFEDLNGKRGIFLENDFWTPPLLSILYMSVTGSFLT